MANKYQFNPLTGQLDLVGEGGSSGGSGGSIDSITADKVTDSVQNKNQQDINAEVKSTLEGLDNKYLASGTKFATINGNDIVNGNDITIDISAKQDKLETVSVVPISGVATINVLAADKLTEINGAVDTLDIRALEKTTHTALYALKFKTSNNWQALSLPEKETFILIGNTLEKDMSYEVSILKNVVNITCLDYGTAQPPILIDKTNVELLFIDENDAEFRITCVAKVESV